MITNFVHSPQASSNMSEDQQSPYASPERKTPMAQRRPSSLVVALVSIVSVLAGFFALWSTCFGFGVLAANDKGPVAAVLKFLSIVMPIPVSVMVWNLVKRQLLHEIAETDERETIE